MSNLSFKEFKRLAKQANVIPLIEEVPADLETPVSAFYKLTSGKHRFLFESLQGGEHWSRYSFLGSEPRKIIEVQGQEITIQEGKNKHKIESNAFDYLKMELKKYRPLELEHLPRFAGGYVGFLGYDMIHQIEDIEKTIQEPADFPDARLMLFDSLIAFDNRQQKLQFIALAFIEEGKSLKQVYEQAMQRLEVLKSRLKKKLKTTESTELNDSKLPSLKVRPKMTKKKYAELVKKAKAYIRAGDIFQVVLGFRNDAESTEDPFEVYRRIRRINPSPYLFYLQMGQQALVGSSPEVMVRKDGQEISVRPIAGTRPRSDDAKEDEKFKREMLADPKERSEHVMLVDLGRNDLGRVAKKGTVHVDEFMVVEQYSHVMHMVSNISAEAKKSVDSIDLLKATFPAGTLSGAPKIRAMEIIEELEITRRGPYGGCVGYFDLYGNMDMAITIRTLAFNGKNVHTQSGAGLVLDSHPEREYEEAQNKAKAALSALKGDVL